MIEVFFAWLRSQTGMTVAVVAILMAVFVAGWNAQTLSQTVSKVKKNEVRSIQNHEINRAQGDTIGLLMENMRWERCKDYDRDDKQYFRLGCKDFE